MTGFAVIDLETTGFAYNANDRVCEIGVVLVDPDGRRERSWTTLVNPQRDLGAQHTHRIDATDARIAPRFADVVGDLTGLLAGRVVVAHNSAFDASFLAAEYARAGWPLGLTPDQTLCTMRLAGKFGAPAKLGDCCAHFGVELADAHAALADAEATAALLAAHMWASGERRMWDEWLAFGETMRWPAPPRLATTPVWRGFAHLLSGSKHASEVLIQDVDVGSPTERERQWRLANAERPCDVTLRVGVRRHAGWSHAVRRHVPRAVRHRSYANCAATRAEPRP